MTTGHSDRVADHFRTDWRDYDRQIRTSIPRSFPLFCADYCFIYTYISRQPTATRVAPRCTGSFVRPRDHGFP